MDVEVEHAAPAVVGLQVDEKILVCRHRRDVQDRLQVARLHSGGELALSSFTTSWASSLAAIISAIISLNTTQL